MEDLFKIILESNSYKEIKNKVLSNRVIDDKDIKKCVLEIMSTYLNEMKSKSKIEFNFSDLKGAYGEYSFDGNKHYVTINENLYKFFKISYMNDNDFKDKDFKEKYLQLKQQSFIDKQLFLTILHELVHFKNSLTKYEKYSYDSLIMIIDDILRSNNIVKPKYGMDYYHLNYNIYSDEIIANRDSIELLVLIFNDLNIKFNDVEKEYLERTYFKNIEFSDIKLRSVSDSNQLPCPNIYNLLDKVINDKILIDNPILEILYYKKDNKLIRRNKDELLGYSKYNDYKNIIDMIIRDYEHIYNYEHHIKFYFQNNNKEVIKFNSDEPVYCNDIIELDIEDNYGINKFKK